MFDFLFAMSIVDSIRELFQEASAPTIPAENWANKELYHKDIINGVSAEQRMENLKKGKYKAVETHPEPHRDINGKIIVENELLYNEDLERYGAIQTQKWVKQGKYNLAPNELKKEKERIEKYYDYLFSL